jgi:hypothetical protein
VCLQAFFIIHLQQPAVRDDEWPSKEKGTLSKAKRNRLPHILALLLIHELIGRRASLLRDRSGGGLCWVSAQRYH